MEGWETEDDKREETNISRVGTVRYLPTGTIPTEQYQLYVGRKYLLVPIEEMYLPFVANKDEKKGRGKEERQSQ